MLKYAKIINEETKECSIGLGNNGKYYESIGMTLMEVEEAYNGIWYIQGFAPSKPIDLMKSDVRNIRNIRLQKTDFSQLFDVPLSEEEKQKYAQYRQYLRDYTNQPNWWEQNPKTFEEWSK